MKGAQKNEMSNNINTYHALGVRRSPWTVSCDRYQYRLSSQNVEEHATVPGSHMPGRRLGLTITLYLNSHGCYFSNASVVCERYSPAIHLFYDCVFEH